MNRKRAAHFLGYLALAAMSVGCGSSGGAEAPEGGETEGGETGAYEGPIASTNVEAGAEALLGPYEGACSEEALPIEIATRLQNLYVVAFFRKHLRGEEGYGAYLTGRYAQEEPEVVFRAR